jgi:REP element-mobilizing transposase RayT
MKQESLSGKALAAGPSPLSGKALAAGPSPLSGKALAAGPIPQATTDQTSDPICDPMTLFITWTTYGTWLPGDSRGWRKWKAGQQQPQPLLEDWCREQMKESPVYLSASQRDRVEKVIGQHAEHRGWALHAVSVRSNHTHVAVTAAAPPKRVRDQLKANGTRVLREPPDPVTNSKIWTKGGDIEFINSDEELEQVVLYINEAQDRMEIGR